MKYLFAILLLIGCKSKPEIMKSPSDFYAEGQKSVRDSIKLNWRGDFYRREIDSLNRKLHENEGMRYFLVGYQCMLKDDHNPITGNLWFMADGFPTKREIDSMIYGGLSRRKECYQPVLILNIYEFKTFGDYLTYSNNYKGQADIKKKKKCCTTCLSSKFYLKTDSIMELEIPDTTIRLVQ